MNHTETPTPPATSYNLTWDDIGNHVPGGLSTIIDVLGMMGLSTSGLGPVIAVADSRPSIKIRMSVEGVGEYHLTIV